MPRYKLTIEYDGTPFVGWQIQGDGVSVQGVLTEAISALCGHAVKVAGALGRMNAVLGYLTENCCQGAACELGQGSASCNR